MKNRMAGLVRTGLISCFVLPIVPPARAQEAPIQIVFTEFTPPVIPAGWTDPVRFEARIDGSPTRVALDRDGVSHEMRDDGQGADRTAGDAIYSLTLEASPIIQGLRSDDVFRRFIGYLDVFRGSTRVLRANVFADVVTDEVPPRPVVPLAPDVQHTDYLVNIVDPEFVLATDESPGLRRVARRFYQYFPDEFDFLSIIFGVAGYRNRHYIGVQNDTLGIGQPLFNSSALFGSAGSLQGILVFPVPTLFDAAEAAFQHELAHRWMNFLRIYPLAGAIPHWPLSDLASGVMGWSDPLTGQGLNFPCLLVPEPGGVRLVRRTGAPVFTNLDLYLMGFFPPDQVGEHLVFADQLQARSLSCTGQLFTGDMIVVRLGDIGAVYGPRIPDAAEAKRHFRVATILVSNHGLLSKEGMSLYSFFARRAEATHEVPYRLGFARGMAKPFAITTRGLGSLSTRLVSEAGNRPPIADAGPDLILECASPSTPVALNGSGSSDPDGDPLEWTWSGVFPEGGGVVAGGSPTVSLPLGTNIINLTVADGHGHQSVDSVSITIFDRTPPTLTCPEGVIAECSGPAGTAVTLSPARATDSCDPDPSVRNSWNGKGADASGDYPPGVTPVEFLATDGSGNMVTCPVSIEVRDTRPPRLSVQLDPQVLWPPDRRLVDIKATVSATDVCSQPTITLASVSIDEGGEIRQGGDGTGANSVAGAGFGTPDFNFQLRAERAGSGRGRNYYVVYTARDASGNASRSTSIVVVPHDQGN